MSPEEMREIIEGIFLRQQMWTLLWVLVITVGFAATSFFGAYFERRAQNYAMKQDFETFRTQLKLNTKTVEQTKAEVQNLRWREILDQELQKTRGVERQELRYKSYGALWQKLIPLAIYDDKIIDKIVVGKLSSDLTKWYFSEAGGLLLTPQAREFYFALQDLLRTTSLLEDWKANRSGQSEGDQKRIFREVLIDYEASEEAGEEANEKPSEVFDYFLEGDFEDWQDKAPAKGKTWREGIKDVAKNWNALDDEKHFATLQQVGSILRTSLTNDLESRFR